jgi:exopolysaccharide biosynthesis polyprenyl glycosylphosphotransferase
VSVRSAEGFDFLRPMGAVGSRAGSRAGYALPWGAASFLVDASMLTIALVLAQVGSPASTGRLPVYWLVPFSLIVLWFLYSRGLYGKRIELQVLDPGRNVIIGTTIATMSLITTRSLIGDPSSATQGLRTWTYASAYLVSGRIALAISERRARRTGVTASPTLIVGAGAVGRLVAARLTARPELGLRPVGFLDDAPLYSEDELGLPVLGSCADIERLIAKHRIKNVVVAFSTAPTRELVRSMARCERLGVSTSFVPRMYERTSTHATVDCLGGIPLVSCHPPDPKGWRFGAKSALDRVGAAVFLLLFWPLLAVLACAVWISSGRPVLYRQERVGRDGRRFGMLKFRSMRPAVEVEQVAPLAPGVAPGGVEGADRRTRIGSFLRRTSLDELPQVLNVLKGEMSFVGPRPERPEFVEQFEQQGVYRYDDRHRVKSGITGWAQVHGLRGKTSIADRVELDNFYIENWTFWLDFKIMLLTVCAAARVSQVE